MSFLCLSISSSKTRAALYLASISFALVGCGGGGGGGGTPVATPQTVSVSGVAAKGLIKGATVCAYQVVNNVRESTPLGGASVGCVTTDSNGAYSFRELPATSNPVILEVSFRAGATVKDELTGQDQPMEQAFKLKTYLYDARADATAQINVFTDLAVEMSRTGSNGYSRNALVSSEAFVRSELLGSQVNPFKVGPTADVLDADGFRLYSEFAKIVAILPDLGQAGGCTSSSMTCALAALSSGFQMTQTGADAFKVTIRQDEKALKALAAFANKEAKLATIWTSQAVGISLVSNANGLRSSLDQVKGLYLAGGNLNLGRTLTNSEIEREVNDINNKFRTVEPAKLAREKSFEVFLEDLEFGVLAFRDFVENPQKRTLVNKFGDAIEEVTESTLFELIDILGDRCDLSESALVCSSAPLALSFGLGPTLTGYSISLTQTGSNRYDYRITKSSPSEAYTGSLSFAAGQVSISGAAPTFYKVGSLKFARSSQINLTATLSPAQALSDSYIRTQGAPITLTINGTQSSAATSGLGVSIPLVSAAFSNFSVSFIPGPGGDTDVRKGGASLAASGAITLTAGGDSVRGQISVRGQDKVGTASLTGNLSMASGETGTLSLTLGLDDTNLTNAAGLRSSANFQKGSLDASLSLSEGAGPAFAGISASYQEAQNAANFNKASLTVTARFSKTEGQRFVRLSVTGLPVDMSSPEASGEILDLPQNQQVSIETSGGFKVSIPARDPRSGVHTIRNADNQEVGKVQNGQIFIGGSVSSFQL